jgi:hypothetical protein
MPDSWQGSGGGPDIQIPRGLELRSAAAMCLLRGVWEASPFCDEEGELGAAEVIGLWAAGRAHLCYLRSLPTPILTVPTVCASTMSPGS